MRFSLIKEEHGLQFKKSYMKVGVKKLSLAGMVPARTWGVRAVVIAPTERFKIKETDGSSSGEKSTASLSLFMNFPLWPLNTGQKASGRENGIMSKEKHA